MKKCSVLPYVGEQKFIFISHSLKDKRYVYPIIEQLVKDGYRVWYDDGVLCGSDATSEIAEKIVNCNLLLAFFSDNTVDSCQFKREVNFAIANKKEIIAVMLEEVHLSPGIELQMSAFPAIFKYRLDNNAFFKSLYSFEIFNECLGMPDDSVVVSDEDEYRETLADMYGVDERRVQPIDDALFIRIKSEEENEIMPKAVLKKLTTNEEIDISTPKMIIGRAASKKIKPIIDYSIETNSMISRVHAVIIYKNKEFYLVDCGALNKTYLNSEELELEKEYLLHDGDIIKFANEKFCFKRFEV